MEQHGSINNIIWTPQPKQSEFLSRPEYEVLYGGAAGGGKSDALVNEALRQVHIPHYRGLILRKTYPECAVLIDKTLSYYGRAYPNAKYNDSKHVWTFPSGAKIYFGSLQHAKDKIKYQGQNYDFIGIDELTHFTYEEYAYLKSRNRPNGAGTRVYIRCTCNPGGIGHGWVKERFITGKQPGKTYTEEIVVAVPSASGSGSEPRAGNGSHATAGTLNEAEPEAMDEFRGRRVGNEVDDEASRGGRAEGEAEHGMTRTAAGKKYVRTRAFIPASVFDNQKLLDNDPDYVATLGSLPEADRRALLYGDWDSFSGQVFTEFRNHADGYASKRWTHVIAPFEIPPYWRRYRSFDFGYSKPFSVGWWAVDGEGRVYRYRELYGCVAGQPDTGVKQEPSEIARRIRAIEDEFERGNTIIGVADPAIWDVRYGEEASPAQVMERHGIYFDKGDNARLAGKMQLHYRLAFDSEGYPMLYVFNTCKDFIRTIPALVYDEAHVEDVDTKGEDHIYDETKYFLMTNPIAARKPQPAAMPGVQELDMVWK